ncbi:MAG: hypothetical protein FJZ07_00540 [Candidatus Nealsonbacteria bacterium]|nr:hypothetical protein [Candidatus Nealsonbacteria bacterium]
MPYRKEKFENGDIAHVILHALDENDVFKDTDDYFRGIFSLYEFNNLNPVSIFRRRMSRMAFKRKNVRGPTSYIFVDERDRMVDILCFCFMPNHIHILVRQIKEGGITEFMRKVGTGYGGYFNRKNRRRGHVFRNSFSAIKIKTDEQLKIVFAYIHANPISLVYKDWKKIRIKENDLNRIIRFLEKYKWSSYLDYIGIQNFSSVTQRDFFLDLFGGEEGYKNFFEDYIKNKGELSKYEELFLE